MRLALAVVLMILVAGPAVAAEWPAAGWEKPKPAGYLDFSGAMRGLGAVNPGVIEGTFYNP